MEPVTVPRSTSPGEIGAPVPPERLSATARALYDDALKRSGNADVDRSAEAAIAEIVDANLGTVYWYGEDYKPGEGRIQVRRIHPLYFVAGGRGWVDIEVELVEHDERTLLGYLSGGHMHAVTHSGAIPGTQSIRVSHPTMTDSGHDATVLADLDVGLITFSGVGHRGVELHGSLTKVRAWALEAPLVGDDGDETGVYECSYESCVEITGGHLIGPFMPPRRPELRTLKGATVALTVRPRVATED